MPRINAHYCRKLLGKMTYELVWLTRRALNKEFEVTTRWQGAMGLSKLPRQYGIVTVGGPDLGEMLVENGLARIHGVNVGEA